MLLGLPAQLLLVKAHLSTVDRPDRHAGSVTGASVLLLHVTSQFNKNEMHVILSFLFNIFPFTFSLLLILLLSFTPPLKYNTGVNGAASHRPCEHLFQVHFHRHLHFRVSHQDLCQRILRHALHLPAGPLELAGFHRHRHGVRHNVPRNSDWFCRSQARLRELIVLLCAHSVFFINATAAAVIDEPIVGGRDLCAATVRLRCPWQIRQADPVIR